MEYADFAPSVAAHELVHTIQQGAVRGSVGTSVPFGSVQMMPEGEEEDKKLKKEDAQEAVQENDSGKAELPAMSAIEKSLFSIFATEKGGKIYFGFSSKLKDLVKKKAGKRNISFTPPKGVRFLIRAAYRDYALRDILAEIAAMPTETKADVKERIRDYKAIIETLSSRLGEDQAESLAIETGMFTGKPKYLHQNSKRQSNRRAYEVTAGENGLVDFNPNNVPQLGKVQQAIDLASTPEQAYRIFAAYTGNKSGRYSDRIRKNKVDMNIFRTKLKHMARVVTDYPELRNNIGDMDVIDPATDDMMATSSTLGGKKLANFDYNVKFDRQGNEEERNRTDKERTDANEFTSPFDYNGTHELGHAMASLLVESDGMRKGHILNNSILEQFKKKKQGAEPDLTERAYSGNNSHAAYEEALYDLPETDMLMEVLAKHGKELHDEYGTVGFGQYGTTGKNRYGHVHLKNQLNTASGDFYKKGLTSRYGSESAGEFFAEAVADVYSHGSSARLMSRELVKEYENRQKKKVREEFRENRKTWWQRFWDF